MGLFSGKDVIQVSSSVTRVIGDTHLPHAVSDGVMAALLHNDDIVAEVQEHLVKSVGTRAERLYNWAETNYQYGLPKAKHYSIDHSRPAVQQVLDTLEGQPVLLEYAHYGPPNTLHYGWTQLVSQYGYNPATNQLAVLTAQKGHPVYLQDMVVVIPSSHMATLEPGVTQQWGIAACAGYTPSRTATGFTSQLITPTPFEVRSDAATELCRVDYVWETVTTMTADGETITTKTLHTERMYLPVTGLDATADYFHAKYWVGGVAKWWTYLDGTGTYPVLDAVFGSDADPAGSFLPWTYFRYDKHTVGSSDGTAYTQAKKMCKYIGIDYGTVAAAIDANPDIGQIDQAILMFGVPIDSTDPIEQRYLYQFFDNMYYSTGEQYTSPMQAGIQGMFHGSGDLSRRAMVIEDNRFQMTVSTGGIYKRRRIGSIGAKGSYSLTQESETVTEEYLQSNGAEEATPATRTYTVPHQVLRYQITETLYDELRIVNLKMIYKVADNYYTGDREGSKTILIPIDHTITEAYPMTDREQLYSRALHFLFNAKVVTHLAWYQTGIFSALLIIIAIVMTIMDEGADGGTWIAKALGASGVSAVIVNVIFNMVIGQIVVAGAKLFVKVFGADVAMLAAVVAIIYGGYQVIEAGSVKGAPWATELLKVASSLTNAAMEAKFDDLLTDAREIQEWEKERTKTLEDAQKLLESKNRLDPFIIFGETPEDFYNRTVHSGNIGVRGIEAIGSYVDIALTLPKFNDTLGGTV